MKKIAYVGSLLVMFFVTAHITNAMETRTATSTTGTVSTITSPIFEKQKWDESRLKLLKEVLRQENIDTREIDPTTKITDLNSSIREFQRKYSIPQTGTVGPMTTQTLNTVVKRQVERPSPVVMPIEKKEFYTILTELPCLNGNRLVTDCTSTKVTPEMLYEKRDTVSKWLTSFESLYRTIRYQNLVSQINTVQAQDQAIRDIRPNPVTTPPIAVEPVSQNVKPQVSGNICAQTGPTLEELNKACTLGYNTQKGECNVSGQSSVAVSPDQCVMGFNQWKKDCNQAHNPGRNVSSSEDNTPRVMFWCGKVNQYWNLQTKRFETDPDGVTGGAMLDPVSYCKKMYPTLSITQAVPYKRELSQNWAERGNINNWTSILTSYACK